jgi:hypothetical protein
VLYNYITQFTDEQLLHAIVYHSPSYAIPPTTPATSHELVCGTAAKLHCPQKHRLSTGGSSGGAHCTLPGTSAAPSPIVS